MVAALAAVAALYAAAAALPVVAVVVIAGDDDPAGGLIAGTIAVALVLLLALHVWSAPRLALRAAGARVLPPGDEPELQALVARLAAQADLRPPRVALVESGTPNAFAVGVRRNDAVVAVTTELLRRLDERELEAVVAHEVAHVANRDGLVMTLVAAFSTAGMAMLESGEDRPPAPVAFAFYSPIFVVGLLLQWTISRYREYAADRGAVLLTGAPEQLMSALQKLEGKPARGDLRGGPALSAFCIVSTQRHGFDAFADHPPLSKRLDALAGIARGLGRVDA
jgi:heat shock protein HtpX